MWNCVSVVQFLQSYDCFGHVNRVQFGVQNFNGKCVKVCWEEKSIILWCVESNVLDGCIGLNPLFAQKLGLFEGTAVCLTICPLPQPTSKVTVYPETEDDLDILEANAHMLQSCLLDQLRLVIANQKMVLWVSPSLSIQIYTNESALLQQHTEVVVMLHHKEADENEHNENCKIHKNPTVEKLPVRELTYFMTDLKQSLTKYSKGKQNKTFHIMRAVVSRNIKDPNLKNIFDSKELFTVYVKNEILGFEEANVHSLRCMDSIVEKEMTQDSNAVSIPKVMFVKVKQLSSISSFIESTSCIKYAPVFIPNPLSNILNIDLGRKLILESATKSKVLPDVIEIIPVITDNYLTNENLATDLKMYITTNFSEKEPLVLNDGLIINIAPLKNVSFQVNLYPKTLKYALVYGEIFRHCKVVLNNEPIQPTSNILSVKQYFDIEDLSRDVESYEIIVKKCRDIIKSSILLKDTLSFIKVASNKNHIFITGPPGSGKTSLCSMIVEDLGVWHMRIECRSIKGRKDVMEHFQKVVQLCEEHSPSILICDDIEAIIPTEHEGASHQDTVFFDMLVYSIRELLYQCERVNVLITATGLDSINSGFKITKGQMLFPFQFSIPELSKSERVKLFKNITKKYLYYTANIKDDDYNKMANETTGLTVRDLVDYMNKKIYKAVKEAVSSKNKFITLETKEKSKNDSDQENNKNIWESLGGMNHTKNTLIEILCWPLKYPGLFPKQPGGILLFGPPGTGKSLIGSCVAKFSQLSFICVKGPELLSKYIGQSEQAVRNLFEKAEKRKPCVLFFDEFDSLAPRRGHDSTGVTDRVVNQFLTQLDGVEGAIKGVTVMAATSRPDLLDGALLRPGRFDTTIHCSMPDLNNRSDILTILSKNIMFSEDVNLREIAEMTEGFSGADLKSILSTAQLQCLEEQLEKLSSDDAIQSDHIMISRSHLLDSLANTRPSLSQQQLRFYDKIYARFLNHSLPEEKLPLDPQFDSRQRATLA